LEKGGKEEGQANDVFVCRQEDKKRRSRGGKKTEVHMTLSQREGKKREGRRVDTTL